MALRCSAFFSRSSKSPPVRSMTATRLSTVSICFRVRYCTNELTAISTGTMTSDRTKALVRTAARYSRTAMVSVLRMGLLRGGDVGDADEDVVQRRVGQLEVADPA